MHTAWTTKEGRQMPEIHVCCVFLYILVTILPFKLPIHKILSLLFMFNLCLFLMPTITTAVGPTHWDTKLPSWSRSSVCSIETPVINRPSVHFLHRFSSCAGPHQLWSDVKPYMNPVPIPSAPLGAGRIYVRSTAWVVVTSFLNIILLPRICAGKPEMGVSIGSCWLWESFILLS